jgi:hypothetical protein
MKLFATLYHIRPLYMHNSKTSNEDDDDAIVNKTAIA